MADRALAQIGGAALAGLQRQGCPRALLGGRGGRGHGAGQRLARADRVPQRGGGRLERVDDGLVADRGGAELLDRRQRGVERRGELGAVDLGRVAERPAGAAQRRPPQRAACAAHRRDQGLAAHDQERPGREVSPPPGQRLLHGVEAADHVGAVIAVADRGVELREAIALSRARRRRSPSSTP